MLLGSAPPLAYEPAWVEGLVGPQGALGGPGPDDPGVDQPADYVGPLLRGPTGVAELLKRPSVAHRDDLPRLEFVAARRFLDSRGTEGVFDSLVGMRAATQAADGASPFLFAKALTVRRGDPAALRYIDAARRARPASPSGPSTPPQSCWGSVIRRWPTRRSAGLCRQGATPVRGCSPGSSRPGVSKARARLPCCPGRSRRGPTARRSEEHTSELQSPDHLVCRLL